MGIAVSTSSGLFSAYFGFRGTFMTGLASPGRRAPALLSLALENQGLRWRVLRRHARGRERGLSTLEAAADSASTLLSFCLLLGYVFHRMGF